MRIIAGYINIDRITISAYSKCRRAWIDPIAIEDSYPSSNQQGLVGNGDVLMQEIKPFPRADKKQYWQIRKVDKSPNYTTKWSEFPIVR